MIPETIPIGRGAYLLPEKGLRFALWRRWDVTKPLALCIGLNPSRADHATDDHTIIRLCGPAGLLGKNGFGGLIMTNLFAQITPFPAELSTTGQEEYLLENDLLIERANFQCEAVIFCWGQFEVLGRDEKMFALFPKADCFGQNRDGSPRHPVRLNANTKLTPFQYPNR